MSAGRKFGRVVGTARTVTVALLSLTLGCIATPDSKPVPTPAAPMPSPTPSPLAFPDDHASHDAATEWWYYSGHAATESGRTYGFHLALFRTQGGETGRTFERVQASIVNLDAGEHRQWTRDGIADSDQVGSVDRTLLNVDLGDARLVIEADGTHSISASDESSGAMIELSLEPSDGRMLHNNIGWMAFPVGYSYYYTIPRMRATGTIGMRGGDAESVDGEVWYDHQWGNFVVLGWPSGWYWAGLNLNDGSSLMVSEVRDVDGDRFTVFGTQLGVDGRQRSLTGAADGIEIEHLEYWTSPETGGEYPVASRVSIESLGLDFVLRPASVEQETVSDNEGNAVASYWEGSVEVVDYATGEVLGRGYLELAGYVKPEPFSWRK